MSGFPDLIRIPYNDYLIPQLIQLCVKGFDLPQCLSQALFRKIFIIHKDCCKYHVHTACPEGFQIVFFYYVLPSHCVLALQIGHQIQMGVYYH